MVRENVAKQLREKQQELIARQQKAQEYLQGTLGEKEEIIWVSDHMIAVDEGEQVRLWHWGDSVLLDKVVVDKDELESFCLDYLENRGFDVREKIAIDAIQEIAHLIQQVDSGGLRPGQVFKSLDRIDVIVGDCIRELAGEKK